MPIVVVYVIAFVLLLFNQSHFIFGGDSAEFSLIAKTWSIAHAPGYPFYSLLINIVNRLLPFGTTPWKVATISSLSTIIASYFIFLILKKCKISTPIALFSGLFYIILFPIWEYSEIPEVFALHNLLVIAITYFILQFTESKKKIFIYLSAFLVGLCVSHHHIFILFIPGWAYILFRKRGRARPLSFLSKKQLLLIALCFLVGCSFYLYAPIAASFSPPLNWENPITLNGFFRLITRASYGTFKAYTGSSGNILNQLFDILSLFIFMVMDFRLVGIALVTVGILTYRKKQPLYTFLIISSLSHIFFLFYTNFTLVVPFTVAMYERFLIPLYMIMIFFLAFGLQSVELLLKRIIRNHIQNGALKKIAGYFLLVFMSAYFLVVFWQNYQTIRLFPTMDIFATYAKNLLDTAPKNSIFFAGSDNSYFTSAYYRFGEGYRSDLKFVFMNQLINKYYRDYVVKVYPGISMPDKFNDKTYIRDFLIRNEKMGLYFENPFGASWKPYGLLWKQYDSEPEAISDSARLVSESNYLWQHVYTIPRLDENLKKILHLNVVSDAYLGSYLEYSRLLFATKHVDEAMQVVNRLLGFQKNDLRSKFILVNINLYNHNCLGAEQIMETIPFQDALRSSDILPSLKDYYATCKPDDRRALKQIAEMENSIKKSISNL